MGLSLARDLLRSIGADLKLIPSDKGATFKAILNSQVARP